ncbi:MAG: NADPH:quinone reductase [Verrucomicrobiota bacterium]
MNAIVVDQFGPPEVLQMREVPDLVPAHDQVLVKLHMSGVNPVDTYIRSGVYGRLPEVPYTPGFDGSGVIAACGSSVRGLTRGLRVYVSGSITGTYAEACLCLPTQIHTLPRQAAFEFGACMGIPYATASYALFHRAKVRRGQTILIHGATGGVGIAALQLAKRAGIKVLATYGSEAGKQLLIQLGADGVFNHNEAGYEAHILETTEGQGVPVILEMLANVNLGRDLPLLAFGGVVCVIGSRGNVQIQPRDLMSRDAEIRGVMLVNASQGVLAQIHGDFFSGLADGSIKPVIRKTFSLERASEAHEMQMLRGACGKILISHEK